MKTSKTCNLLNMVLFQLLNKIKKKLMINNLLTIICILLLHAGTISTEHKSAECEHNHLATIKVHAIDCAHNNHSCLECTNSEKSSIPKTFIKRVSVNRRNVFRNNTAYKYFPPTNRLTNYQLPYTTSSEPPGNLVIHRFLDSVIILT